MRRGLALAMWGLAGLRAAQPAYTVNETVKQVRAALGGKQKDEQVARLLRKWQLAEALDEHTIEELESEGAGTRTVAELERLREGSAKLPQAAGPSLFPSPPAPLKEEQARVLDKAREAALHYSDSLPNFLAAELLRRYSDERGGWQLRDTIRLKLSYVEHQEDYQVLTINGRRSQLAMEEVGGTITQGEFGSLLLQVFDPRSAAGFEWDHWTMLRGRRTHVFRFRVAAENSRYTMTAGTRGDRYTSSSSVKVGQHGMVYVDQESLQITRIMAEADAIPAGFPVRNTSTLLDYGFVDVGGRRFLLPLHAKVWVGTRGIQYRNEVEFEGYQKFGAQSSITFEGPVKP